MTMMNPTTHRIAAAVALLLCVSCAALADPPPGYYGSVHATNSTTLRTTLHEVIDDHTRFPYTSGSTDTWDILELADEDLNNSSNIIDAGGSVGAADLAIVLGSWGPCEGCPADFNGDDMVGPFDLAILLGSWGMCP